MLGEFLHHSPSTGAGEEQETLRRCFARVATFYAETFGEDYFAVDPDGYEARVDTRIAAAKITKTEQSVQATHYLDSPYKITVQRLVGICVFGCAIAGSSRFARFGLI